jgi:hypothetical protein
MSSPINTFVQAEEGKRALTVHYRTEIGEPGAITFSEQGQPEGYRLELVSVGGRASQEMSHVDMYFTVDGAQAVEIMQITNAEGVKVKDGVLVTHYTSVHLPREDAHRLSWQLHNFVQPAEYLIKELSPRIPRIESISYVDDYITVHFNRYRFFKLGLVPDKYRFTFSDYKLRSAPIDGFICMVFSFLDEKGDDFSVQFASPLEDAARMDIELRDFLESYRRGRLEAVTPPISGEPA